MQVHCCFAQSNERWVRLSGQGLKALDKAGHLLEWDAEREQRRQLVDDDHAVGATLHRQVSLLQEQKQTVQKVWISRQKVEIPAVSRIAFRDGLESFDENDFSSFSPLQKVTAGLEADRVVVAQRVLERHQLKSF